MKRAYWYPLALAAIGWAAASGQYGTQLLVLTIALGIFFETVSIRSPRASDATTQPPGL